MKYLFFFVLLSNCALQMDYSHSFYSIKDPMEAMEWIYYNIEYKTDASVHGREYFQTPEETLMMKTGDCDDMAILMASWFKSNGKDSFIYGYKKTDGTYHVISFNGNHYYDPVLNIRTNSPDSFESFCFEIKY